MRNEGCKVIADFQKDVIADVDWVVSDTLSKIRVEMLKRLELMAICGNAKAKESESQYLQLREKESICMMVKETIHNFLDIFEYVQKEVGATK